MRKCTIAVLASIFVAAACAANAAPSGPFLPKPALDTKNLVRQISKDRIVATRYGKHYGTTPAALLSYFRANLRLGRLTRPHVTSVYVIGHDGNPVRRVVTLAPGTRVFSTTWGEPVLESDTGNPLGDKLPLPPKLQALKPGHEDAYSVGDAASEMASAKGNAPVEMAEAEDIGQTITGDDIVTKVLAAPPLESTTPPLLGQETPLIGTETEDDDTPGTVVAALPTLVTPPPVVATAPAAPPVGGGHSWGPFAVVGGLGALAALLSGQGGGAGEPGSSDLPPVDNPPPPPPGTDTAVPEPASMLALSAGLALLVARRRR